MSSSHESTLKYFGILHQVYFSSSCTLFCRLIAYEHNQWSLCFFLYPAASSWNVVRVSNLHENAPTPFPLYSSFSLPSFAISILSKAKHRLERQECFRCLTLPVPPSQVLKLPPHGSYSVWFTSGAERLFNILQFLVIVRQLDFRTVLIFQWHADPKKCVD